MSSTFRPGTAAEPTSEVELTLSCRWVVWPFIQTCQSPGHCHRAIEKD